MAYLSTQPHSQLPNCWIVRCDGDFLGHIYKTASGQYYAALTSNQVSLLRNTGKEAIKDLHEHKLHELEVFNQTCAAQLQTLSNGGHTFTPGMQTKTIDKPRTYTRKDGKVIPVSYGAPAPKKRHRSTSVTVGRSNVAAIGYRGGPGQLINGCISID
ncbi:hypothetical protein ACSYAD_33205 [Acaryochloris marina NIES-2412]|uniref:hypothetical protein n=1 Tax=Acaryochloris marina TaxID=155978 RepID=UPI004059A2EF